MPPAQVTRVTAIRHKGEGRNNPDLSVTLQRICDRVLEVKGIKEPPCEGTVDVPLRAVTTWKAQQQQLKDLKVAASKKAAAIYQQQAAESSPGRPDVLILSHNDTVHFAAHLLSHLKHQAVGAVHAMQPSELDLEEHAAQLLAAQVCVWNS